MNTSTDSAIKASARIKLFVVTFDFEIERKEIPAFRAAIIKKVGCENILFHNHLGENFRYGYPLIQYKVFRKNPTIVCINKGSEEILKFFEQTNWNMVLNGRDINTKIKHLSFDYLQCGFSEKLLKYKIENWFALNEINFKKFILLSNDRAQIKLLERIIIGNILSFAKGIKWNIKQQVELAITHLPREHSIAFKNHQMMGFNISFVTNVLLPDVIGLGKSVSRGFGVIRKVDENGTINVYR